ncbi:MAG TPA: DUF4232 domain-containing protein [Acidimicrobiales bacterium]|nr:DUF4232 domain-containing protein [Acidimicrobiales bacterium]
MRRAARRAPALALALAAGAAACSGPPTVRTPAAPRPPAPAGPRPSAPAGPAPAPAQASGARCRAGQLSAGRTSTREAAGQVLAVYSLRNVSGTACVLFGYPAISLVGPAGQALPTTVVRGGSALLPPQAPQVVVLNPGSAASFRVAWSGVPQGGQPSCPASARLEITPPGDFSSVVLADQIAPCGPLHVSPVAAGDAASP